MSAVGVSGHSPVGFSDTGLLHQLPEPLLEVVGIIVAAEGAGSSY